MLELTKPFGMPQKTHYYQILYFLQMILENIKL